MIKFRQSVLVVVGKQRHIFSINPMQLGIAKHIPGYETKHARDVLRLSYSLYKYTLRLGMVSDMKKLRAVPITEITAIKDSIFTSYDLVLYKLATIKCLLRKYDPGVHWNEIGDTFEHYGLLRDDRLLYAFLYYNGDAAKLAKELKKVKDGFPLTVDALRKEIEEVSTYRRLRNAASAYSSRKLAFVAKGNRFEKKDMASDLLLRGVQAYYWVRPFYSKLHAINYACSAMAGWTKCLITYYTDESRARIVATPDGYDNVTRDFGEDVPMSDQFTEDCMLTWIDFKRGAYDEVP